MKTSQLIATFFVLFLLYPTIIFAEVLPETESPDVPDFGEETFYEGIGGDVIISATKIPTRLVEVPAIATVIHADQIRNMGARTLADVLKIVPGIIILTSKDLGVGINTIEVRGISTFLGNNILFMIDGHRTNTLIYGGAAVNFYDMTVENIKRVEVIRGPGSALHGANAFSASINVVTKGPEDVDGLEVLAGGGSKGAKHLNLLFGKTFSKLKIAGFFDYLGNDSSELSVESDVTGMSGNTDDWRRKIDVGLKASYGKFGFNSRFVRRNAGTLIGVANALNDESEVEYSLLFGELSYREAIGDRWHILAKVYADRFTFDAPFEVFSEGVIPGFPDGFLGHPEAKNRTLGTELQIDYILWDDNTMTAGMLYEDKEQFDVRARANFNPLTGAPLGSVQDVTAFGNWNQNKGRAISALYLQDVWAFTQELEGTFGLRYDRYSDFGDTFNPRAGLVWSLWKNANLKFLYGTAFRAPNFEELYNRNNPVHVGDPDLDPEKVTTYEVSLGYFPKHVSANVTYFYSDFKNIINWSGVNPVNSDRWKVDGVELAGKMWIGSDNMVYTNFTYQNPKDDLTGKRLPGVSRYFGNLGVNWVLNKYLNFNSSLTIVGKRSRAVGDTRPKLDGYEVVDLTVIVKNFYETTEVRAYVNNLFDETYFDPAPVGTVASDFPRQGINFMFDVRMKFQ